MLSYLRLFRAPPQPRRCPHPRTVRAVANATLLHPDRLDADEQLTLKQARARCPHLDATADHVSAFAEMMVGRHGEGLDDWIAQVEADDLPTCIGSPTGCAAITPPCATV